MNKTLIQKNRNDLAATFIGVGAEIGVERAAFSEQICKSPNVEMLYGIDPLKAYRGYREHVTQSKLDGFLQDIMLRMMGKRFSFIREFSVDAARWFEQGSLDFVYIDANHDYDNVMADLCTWVPKVKSGGIVSGHDYIKRKGQKDLFNVVEAVDDYCQKNGIKDLFIYKGDKSPSWCFIKD